MAKITAKSQPNGFGKVKIEGRMDDACLLTADVIRSLGASIRATFAVQGVTQLEPEGEEENDIALAMTHIWRAVMDKERDEAKARTPDPANDDETIH